MTSSSDKDSVLHRMESAQKYLAEHHVKELYAKLVYEATLYRVNNPISFFQSRLHDIEKHGLHHERVYPRIIFVVGGTTELHTFVYRSLCDKFNMRYINIFEGIQEEGVPMHKSIIRYIEKEMKESDNLDFLLDAFPANIKQAIEFEKELIECRYALHIHDENVHRSQEEIKSTLVLQQYFGALDKLRIFPMINNDVEATVEAMSKLFL